MWNVVIIFGGRGVYYVNELGVKGFVFVFKVEVVDIMVVGDMFIGVYVVEVVGVE